LLHELHDVALTFGVADPATRRRLAAEAAAALGRAGGAFRPGVSPRLAWLSCFVLDGCWAEVDQILRDLTEPGISFLRRELTGTRATLARYRGNPTLAWSEVRSLFPAGPDTEPGDVVHQEGLNLHRLAADLCLDAGDLAGARSWLTANDAWLAWSGSVLGRADGQLAWARYHLASAEPDHARARASDALALAATPDQSLVRLAAHRLLGEPAIAARDVAAAAAHLTAALDLADACEVPFERALTLLALAELRAAMGTTGEAVALLEEVRRICAPLGAAPALARADALAARLTTSPQAANPAGLTQRELEVLRLLARHHTDKEIAEALFVGLRTVQTHVANILNKLGVGNRREATAEAARLGLV
jgi:DNA-binding CsgD family transcriptional regulator